jgi:hypothetical protein
MKKYVCKVDRCLLSEIYPNSDASLACDCECYLIDNQKNLKYYEEKFKNNAIKRSENN